MEDNSNVRILYPTSDKYKTERALDDYRTFFYEIPLFL